MFQNLVSGVAYPGELLAVLGSSGAGKTTLLNTLAFRTTKGVQLSPSTLRMLNGNPVEAVEMQARCAYVQQDDLFIGSLTAREHLIFQAMLRMPRNTSYQRKLERVDQVIQDLSLGKCKNTIIGVPGRTIAELPLFLTVPFVFTSIAYPLIGLRPGVDHYFIALALVTLIANVSTSFGYFISCASTSTSMALNLGSPLIIPLLLFGGYFLNSRSVPPYFKWLSYLSWFRYGNEGLLINQWSDVQAGEIECTNSNSTCPSSGQVILETLNFQASDLPIDFIALVSLIVGFRFFAYLALLIKTKKVDT
uniref:ABC transporter domain-containing protein n=1 Tax=Megaselia scalaris TaxID=36166 RepID=T1GGV8_MEGSC